jgi:hypothetical protein
MEYTVMKIEEFEAQAAAEYPGIPVEFSDGVTIVLRSSLDLDADSEMLMEAARKEYQALDEATSEIADVRRSLVEVLAVVADDYELAKERFTTLRLSVLQAMLKEANKQQTDAAKSSEGSD